MLITGVVFAVFLAGLQEELQTTIPWVDFVLHRLTPLVLFVDWLVDPPRRRLAWRMALVWLAYPVAYGAYSLARGAVVDWYPYPFLDVGEHGYGGVLALGVVLLAGMALAALMIVWLGERGRARRQPSGSGLARRRGRGARSSRRRRPRSPRAACCGRRRRVRDAVVLGVAGAGLPRRRRRTSGRRCRPTASGEARPQTGAEEGLHAVVGVMAPVSLTERMTVLPSGSCQTHERHVRRPGEPGA